MFFILFSLFFYILVTANKLLVAPLKLAIKVTKLTIAMSLIFGHINLLGIKYLFQSNLPSLKKSEKVL